LTEAHTNDASVDADLKMVTPDTQPGSRFQEFTYFLNKFIADGQGYPDDIIHKMMGSMSHDGTVNSVIDALRFLQDLPEVMTPTKTQKITQLYYPGESPMESGHCPFTHCKEDLRQVCHFASKQVLTLVPGLCQQTSRHSIYTLCWSLVSS
jgi:hypothetical protein